MPLGNKLGNIQSQTRTHRLLFQRILRAEKLIKYLRLILLRYSNTRIRNENSYTLAIFVKRNSNRATSVAISNGVDNKLPHEHFKISRSANHRTISISGNGKNN